MALFILNKIQNVEFFSMSNYFFSAGDFKLVFFLPNKNISAHCDHSILRNHACKAYMVNLL